jgi:hypothetical protein
MAADATLKEQVRDAIQGQPDRAAGTLDPRAGNPVATALEQYTASRLPEELADFLGRLALFYGMPFENLVPDESALPRESIRFFYIDANWLEALVDGAFSTGAHTRLDIRYHGVLQHTIRQATEVAAGKLRSDIRGDDPVAPPIDDTRLRAGFLMRSAAVSGWPGMEVSGFKTLLRSVNGFDASDPITAGTDRAEVVVGKSAIRLSLGANNTLDGLKSAINGSQTGVTATIVDTPEDKKPLRLEVRLSPPWDANTPPVLEVRTKAGTASTNILEPTKMQILRLDRVSPEVLLCVFPEVPDRIELNEPAEGLHFGMSVSNANPLQASVTLRNPNTGRLVSDASVPVPFRDASKRVVDAASLAAALRTALGSANIPVLDDTGTARPFLSADYAIQMVDPAHKEVISHA